MDKAKKRVRAHANKHGMSYQAAWNQLEGRKPNEALEFWDWMKHVNGESDCLTIGDILKLKKGERVPILVMDRNLCDHVYPDIGEGPKPIQLAQEFFDLKRDGAVYVHREGMTGTVEWGWDDEHDSVDELFTFEIEFKKDHWYPLDEDGTLPAADEEYQVGPPEPWDEEVNGAWDGTAQHGEELPPTRTHWKDYPETTHVGWRGPMMRWDRVTEQPPVFTNIDIDRLAAQAALPMIKQALDLGGDRLWLAREGGEWVLVVNGLTDEESEQLKRRFTSVKIQARDARASSLTTVDEDVDLLFERLGPEAARLQVAEQLTKLLQMEDTSDEDVPRAADLLFRRAHVLLTLATELSCMEEEMPEEVQRVLALIEWPVGIEPPTFAEIFDEVRP